MVKREIIINTKYNELRDFVESLPTIFEREGSTIRRARNEVKVFDVDGLLVNVKRYCRPPYLFNRVVYNLFRESKAERAYYYALRLLELEINTPDPIAYIEESHGLLLGYCYFVSIQVPYKRCYDEFVGAETLTSEGAVILSAFGRYTADIHQKGILHKDYSPGNILYDMKDGEPEFCLIDINRMDFGALTKEQCFTNFGRLYGTPEMYRVIARSYAEAQGWSEEECYEGIVAARAKYKSKQRLKPKRVAKKLFSRG